MWMWNAFTGGSNTQPKPTPTEAAATPATPTPSATSQPCARTGASICQCKNKPK